MERGFRLYMSQESQFFNIIYYNSANNVYGSRIYD